MIPAADFALVFALVAGVWIAGYVAGIPFAWIRKIKDAA